MIFFEPPKHFKQEEFVDPITCQYYRARGWKVWRLFNPGILYAVYCLRERYGKPIRINDGVKFKWRGFRTPACDVYSAYSQHSLGAAVDFDVDGMPAEEVRKDILAHQMDKGIEYITALEMTKDGKPISWVHVDCRNHDKGAQGIKQIHEGRAQ